MKTIALEEAVALIPDGASLMVGGFMGVKVQPVLDATEAELVVPAQVPQIVL